MKEIIEMHAPTYCVRVSEDHVQAESDQVRVCHTTWQDVSKPNCFLRWI